MFLLHPVFFQVKAQGKEEPFRPDICLAPGQKAPEAKVIFQQRKPLNLWYIVKKGRRNSNEKTRVQSRLWEVLHTPEVDPAEFDGVKVRADRNAEMIKRGMSRGDRPAERTRAGQYQRTLDRVQIQSYLVARADKEIADSNV